LLLVAALVVYLEYENARRHQTRCRSVPKLDFRNERSAGL
jgi:hypothetical protein